ncbi:MAG: methionine adenosyltransferase domain-containing protein, partial [Bacteroidota bacterium]|nr:methionine adenosyltransferase domain-containing protein [Bacteroidota bacterium]
VAYAIGVAEPVGLYVTTYGTTKVKDSQGNIMSDGEIAEKVSQIFDMRPYGIVKRFGLQNPIFAETAAYGHMGRPSGTKKVEVQVDGKVEVREYETFTWEKLDYVDQIKAAFSL